MTGPSEIEGFRRALLDHFDRSRRDLPWRSARTPYRVLVSEVMLQQTRVETVTPYYSRWLERFPTLDALAEAPLDDVLLLWKGLGYYSRARNLHRAARIVRDRLGGRIPDDVAGLRELPGIGEYTAGAVASIAFGRPAVAVDGNVRRVLARILDEADPRPARLREAANSFMDRARPGDFNEALMELGATICVPRSPRCGECPVEAHCAARARGTVDRRPARRRVPAVPTVEHTTAVVVAAGGEVFLARRDDSGLLGGLWEFPTWPRGAGADDVRSVLDFAAGLAGSQVKLHGPLPPVRHRYSHFVGMYHPVLVRLAMTPTAMPLPAGRMWSPLGELDGVAVPVAQQKVARHAEDALGRGL